MKNFIMSNNRNIIIRSKGINIVVKTMEEARTLRDLIIFETCEETYKAILSALYYVYKVKLMPEENYLKLWQDIVNFVGPSRFQACRMAPFMREEPRITNPKIAYK